MQDLKKIVDDIYQKNFGWKPNTIAVIQYLARGGHVKSKITQLMELYKDEQSNVYWILEMILPEIKLFVKNYKDVDWLSKQLDVLYDNKRWGKQYHSGEKGEMTKANVKKWLENKNINPKTGKKIISTGKVYKEFHSKSVELGLTKGSPTKKKSNSKKSGEEFTKKELKKWLKDKERNPQTNRKISLTGKIYMKLEKAAKRDL